MRESRSVPGWAGWRVGRAVGAVALGLVLVWVQAAPWRPGGVPGLALSIVSQAAFLVSLGLVFFGSTRATLGFLAFATLATCYFFERETAEVRALADRGVTGQCQVLDVTERTVTEHTSGNGAGDPGTTTTRTVYDHRLDCPPGGPHKLSRSTALGSEGEDVTLTWDPDGEVDARPAASVERERTGTSQVWAVVTGAATLALVVVDAGMDIARYRPRPGRGRAPG
jgi:hypothetical protein